MSPVVAVPEEFMLFNAAMTKQTELEPDDIRCAAGCTWSAAISGQCNSTGDAILQSTPCGTLHDGNGSVAPTSRLADMRNPAACRVQCVHVLPGLFHGGAYVSREAKLNYLTVTVIEQYFCIPCSVMC